MEHRLAFRLLLFLLLLSSDSDDIVVYEQKNEDDKAKDHKNTQSVGIWHIMKRCCKNLICFLEEKHEWSEVKNDLSPANIDFDTYSMAI